MPAYPYLFAGTPFQVNLVTLGMTWLSGLVVLIVLLVATRKLDMRHPRGLQNLMEWASEFVTNMAKDTMPNERAVNFVLPLAFTMLLFLFVANWLGLIMTISIKTHHAVPALGLTADALAKGGNKLSLFDSPTANMSMTLGLSVMVWVIAHARGLRHPGVYFKHYLNPMNILEEITNPLTHGMRLFGNIFAGEALLGVMLGIPLAFGWVPIGLPLILVWLFYSGFVSTIQAYVFTILLTLYIGNKSYDGHHAH